MTASRRSFLALILAMPLAGCMGGGAANSGKFRTYFAEPVAPDLARAWRLSDVTVTAPESLTVSEARSYEPRADIVWREDDIGADGGRHGQVERIMREAIRTGASGLKGARAIRLQVTMSRFHALTFEAESLPFRNIGVHNVNFAITVLDARTGATLLGPVEMEASFPAKTGNEMVAARIKGETQKSHIQAHVAATIRAWLGLGPDNRGSFSRAGA